MKPIHCVRFLFILLLSTSALANLPYPKTYAYITPYYYNNSIDAYEKSKYFFIGEKLGEGAYKTVLRINDLGTPTNTLIAITKLATNTKTEERIEYSSKTQTEYVTGLEETKEELNAFQNFQNNKFTVAKHNNEVILVNCLEDKSKKCAAYFVEYINDPAGQSFLRFNGAHTTQKTKNEMTETQVSFYNYIQNIKTVVKSLALSGVQKDDSEKINIILNDLRKLREQIKNTKDDNFYDFQGFLKWSNGEFVVIDPPHSKKSLSAIRLSVLKELNHLIATLKYSIPKNNTPNFSKKSLELYIQAFDYVESLIRYASRQPDLDITSYLNVASFDDFLTINIIAKGILFDAKNLDFKIENFFRSHEAWVKYAKLVRTKFFDIKDKF